MAYLQVSQCRHLPRHVTGRVPPGMRTNLPGLSGQAGGMGQWAQALTSILGPLVEGGVTGYAVYAQSQQQKKELKQRQQEVLIQQAAAQKAQEEQSKQFAMAQQAAIQQAQLAKAYAERAWPYVASALGLGALALVTVAGVRMLTSRRKERAA